MQLALRRVTIFTGNMTDLARFYGEVLGLPVLNDGPRWKMFDAGAVQIALHNGSAMLGRRPPKLVFHTDDVAAARETLNRRGARFGPVKQAEDFAICDAKDPDGNPIQISSRP
ncbi:VOC family protein [Pelagibius litoralis]|uniref:VOC family protein n=1 Tax=Pelagibius litoralis TaxID=374515 RepID=A0A967F129_9PROT|nr:VOC family protein [Pelagibius litoralis]NIA71078.1 VOC family protein [Pelagibius litoralis]